MTKPLTPETLVPFKKILLEGWTLSYEQTQLIIGALETSWNENARLREALEFFAGGMCASEIGPDFVCDEISKCGTCWARGALAARQDSKP